MNRIVPFFQLSLFQSSECLQSRPRYHAEEEFDCPRPLSSRFREIRISTNNHDFGPQPSAFRFSVFGFLSHLRVFSRPLTKSFLAPIHHLVNYEKLKLRLRIMNLDHVLKEILVFYFFDHLEMFSRPFHRAED